MIRQLETKDVEIVSHLCLASFNQTVAPTLQEEGIKTFSGVASVDAFHKRMAEDNAMLVYERKGEILGYVELKEGRHIAMLFVSPSAQKRGIGRALMSAALALKKSQVVTVSASLTSVGAYQNFGFEVTGDEKISAGLSYQPMEYTS